MSVTALYARVSSGRQEQERTIESQIAEIERCADVSPSHRFIDDGWSGHVLQRPGLDALRDAAAMGSVGRVVIYDPDRLARRFIDQQIVIEELERQDVEVVFLAGGRAQTDEERMAQQMRGVFAEYERAKILERTRRGRLHRARRGAPPGWSSPPYGYRYLPRERSASSGTVLVEEIGAEWVRTIYRWVADEGLTIRRAAKRLEEQAVPSPRGRRWMTGTVGRLLRNPVYTGTAHHQKYEAVEPKQPRDRFGYRRTRKSSQRRRPPEQWIAVSVPAIVDLSLFERVQERLKSHLARTAGQARHPHLLRRLLKCASCGRTLVARAQRSAQRIYRYYTCGARDRFNAVNPGAACALQRSVGAEAIEAAVWEDIAHWLQEPQQLALQMQAHAQQLSLLVDAHREEQRHIRRQLRAFEDVTTRLVDGYQAGAVSVDELRARRERLDEQRTRYERRLEELDAQDRRRLAEHAIADQVQDLCENLRAGLAASTFEDRRAIVELLVEKIEIAEADLKIHYIVPLRGTSMPPTSETGSTSSGPGPRQGGGQTKTRAQRSGAQSGFYRPRHHDHGHDCITIAST